VTQRERAPFGSWPSPLTAAAIAQGGLRLGEPRIANGRVYWLEGRAAEGGRTVLMCADRGEAPVECVGSDVDVRSRVHEYGGGAYCVASGRTFIVDDAAGRLRELERGAVGRADARYADLALDPAGSWLVAVEEVAGEGAGGEPANRLVALGVGDTGRGERLVVDGGRDFVSFPTFAPDGRSLAWTGWDHPNMPWDGTRVYRVAWGPRGPEGPVQTVAGGDAESIFQPRFGPDGTLYYVSDRSGWWNLYADRDGESVALFPMEAEFGADQWAFGLSRYDFVDATTIVCVIAREGSATLARIDLTTGALETIDVGLTAIEGVRVERGEACLLGASPTRALSVYRVSLATGGLERLQNSLSDEPEPDAISIPQAVSFENPDGDPVHAFFYPPTAPGRDGLDGERPPLLVKSHGGPTGVAYAALDLRVQYWTRRGFAVADVNYTGSTTFGREARGGLDGQWGIADVNDCVAVAEGLAAEGAVDGERMLISGGSAGGYTTLCALTFHDVFRAGASHYGIGDLEALARDTHKFESRYLDRLVACYPADRDRYRERSPIHYTADLRCPVIFFQGLEDKVVPPSQAEAMVEALAAQGILHAYVPFAGEGHGFRQANNIRTALEGELYFYSRVLGFEVETAPSEVRIAGGERASRDTVAGDVE
jgi:dipeptidyl aminopeptidase/acylaminoacyl peptidase